MRLTPPCSLLPTHQVNMYWVTAMTVLSNLTITVTDPNGVSYIVWQYGATASPGFNNTNPTGCGAGQGVSQRVRALERFIWARHNGGGVGTRNYTPS